MGDIRIPALKGFSLDDFRGWCKRQRIAAILDLNNTEQIIPGIIEKTDCKTQRATPFLSGTKVAQRCAALAILNLRNHGCQCLAIQQNRLVERYAAALGSIISA